MSVNKQVKETVVTFLTVSRKESGASAVSEKHLRQRHTVLLKFTLN